MSTHAPHDRLTDELAEQAALFALGMLDPKQESRYRSHLASGCVVCGHEVDSVREAAGHLAFSAPLQAPPPDLRARVLAALPPDHAAGESPQVWRAWTASQASSLHVVRRDEGDWRTVRSGVHVKRLYADPERDTVTMLLRMDAGANWVPHRHAGPELCLVLEGDVHADDLVLNAGDFQCAAEDSVHGVQWTEGGCLLLITCSQHDELLP